MPETTATASNSAPRASLLTPDQQQECRRNDCAEQSPEPLEPRGIVRDRAEDRLLRYYDPGPDGDHDGGVPEGEEEPEPPRARGSSALRSWPPRSRAARALAPVRPLACAPGLRVGPGAMGSGDQP